MADNRPARMVAVVLGVIVVVLVGSTVYARLWPKVAMRTHGAEQRVVRVQVLNGSGEGGVASKVAAFLREGGFHVVEVKNADRFDYFPTLVVARTDIKTAEEVARYLGDPPVIRPAWNSDVAEVTVVLGSDRSHLRLQ